MTKAKWAVVACAAVCAWGCGQFVEYGDGAPGPVDATPLGGGEVEVGDLTELNHYAWAGLVASFTSEQDGDVLVDYVAWSQDDEAIAEIDRYLGVLAAVDASDLSSPEQRQAYWINAYNAATVRGVIADFGGDADGYSVITSGVFFDTPRYTFGGVTMTLNQVEQGVMRGDLEDASVAGASEETRAAIARWAGEIWGPGGLDARFHAAVNCAALGCPNLWARPPYAWRAEGIDAQLEEATRAWLASPTKGAGPAGISNLFEWYASDFEVDAGGVEAFIAEHREGGTAGVDLGTIITYDWTLNAP
jgi:hypothetical protein